MNDRFTQRLFYVSIILLGLGVMFFFMGYPSFEDTMLLTNLWMFFLLFGTIFTVLTIITIDFIYGKEKREENQPKKH